jgi:putative hydrolase of the HAD superfamily
VSTRSLATVPRAICFDVGGTLILADGAKVASLAAALGHELDPERCRDAFCAASVLANESDDTRGFGRGEGYAAAWAAYAGVPEVDIAALWDAMRRSDAVDASLWSELRPDAAAVLAALAERGIMLAAVSNAEGHLRAELERAHLLQFFDAVVDSRLVGFEKPDPRIFEVALGRLDVHPAHCWVVGNEYVMDLLAARDAGITNGILYDRLERYRPATGAIKITALTNLLELLPDSPWNASASA